MEKPDDPTTNVVGSSEPSLVAPTYVWSSLLDDPIAKWASRNPVLSATAAAFVLIVVDVLTMAHYRVDTALAIISTADTAKVVLGVTAGVAPLLLPALVLLCWAWRQQLMMTGQEPTFVTMIGCAVALLAFLSSSIFLLFTYLVILIAAVWLPTYLTRRRGRPSRGYLPVGEHRTLYFLFLLVLALIPFVENPSPWLPEEIVSSQEGQQLVGYVIGDSGAFTMVVTAADRRVVFTKSGDIQSRVVCHPDNPWFFLSLPSIASPPPGPTCP